MYLWSYPGWLSTQQNETVACLAALCCGVTVWQTASSSPVQSFTSRPRAAVRCGAASRMPSPGGGALRIGAGLWAEGWDSAGCGRGHRLVEAGLWGLEAGLWGGGSRGCFSEWQGSRPIGQSSARRARDCGGGAPRLGGGVMDWEAGLRLSGPGLIGAELWEPGAVYGGGAGP